MKSRVVQITHNGGPEVLQLVEQEVPAPGAGEVLLRHHAVGLNFIDVYQRSGLYQLPLPLNLGMEAAGVVEAVGQDVKHLKVVRARPYLSREDPNPDDWQLLRGFGKVDGYRSFPSGHALAAFAAGAAVTAEMSRWHPESRWVVGTVMYGGAGMVGLSRMYENRHWASDVIIGAAIGTFAGNKVVRYHHSNPGNRIDEWLVNFSLSPEAGVRSLSLSVFPRSR